MSTWAEFAARLPAGGSAALAVWAAHSGQEKRPWCLKSGRGSWGEVVALPAWWRSVLEAETTCKQLSRALCSRWSETQVRWGLVHSRLFL